MHDKTTRQLLTAGMLAGPIALTADFAQAFLREGFDIRRHASSQLGLGDWGWIQCVNFVVAGLLVACLAIGARRVLKGRVGGLWGPILLGVFAVCHVLVGVFTTDPGFGFPPGPDTPAGMPAYDQASFHAVMHSIAGGLGFNALAIGCFVFMRHFGFAQLRWTLLSLATAAVILGIGIYAGIWESQHTDPAVRAAASFNFLPMWATLPVVWGYLTALAWKLKKSTDGF